MSPRSGHFAKQLAEPEDQAFHGIGARSARWTLHVVLGLTLCSAPVSTVSVVSKGFGVSRSISKWGIDFFTEPLIFCTLGGMKLCDSVVQAPGRMRGPDQGKQGQTRENRVHCQVLSFFLKLQVAGGWILKRSCAEGLQPFIPMILGFGFLFRRLVFGFLIAVWMHVLQDCRMVLYTAPCAPCSA